MAETAKESHVTLQAERVCLSFGGVVAIDGVSFGVHEGEIVAIIGPNGAGKTALLNCINGFYRPQSGRILYNGKNLVRLVPHAIAKMGIARTFQAPVLYTGLSVRDNILSGRHFHIRENLLTQMLWFGPALRTEAKELQVVERIIDFLEIENIRQDMVGVLPYGLRKRVELGRALAMQPRVLLTDEPMAGMSLEEKQDMARFLLDVHELEGITIILVEHDMGLVMDIADRIIVLDFGRKIAEGTPEEIRLNPNVARAYLGTQMQVE